MPATSATTSMSQSFSTFNFVDVKNIEVSLARSAPSNTCQSQSIVPSAAAEHFSSDPVCDSIFQQMETHAAHTAAGWRKSSRPWNRKWRTTAASLELRRCLHYWWQSDGKQQRLLAASLTPTKCHLQTRRRENVFPRTEQTLRKSNARSQGGWASTTVSKAHSERGLPWCIRWATLTVRRTVLGKEQGRIRREKNKNKPETQERREKNSLIQKQKRAVTEQQKQISRKE